MSLSEKIIRLRKSKGMSQELLAENSRLSLRTIQRIESGTSMPRPYTLKVIADTLGVSVDQLNLMVSPSNIKELAILRLINLSALIVFVVPFGNIILPLMVWRKSRYLPGVNVIGRRIISFQLLWTLGTILVVLFIQIMLKSLTLSVSIGHSPPTIFLVYLILLIVNFLFIIWAALQLSKEKTGIYSFVPVLF